MKSLVNYRNASLTIGLAYCIVTVSSCKYLDRFTKKENVTGQEVSSTPDLSLPKFEFFLFRSSDRTSATFDARTDGVFTCQYRLTPTDSLTTKGAFTPCSNNQPALIATETITGLVPAANYNIDLKVQMGLKEYQLSYTESSTVCTNTNETPSIQLDQVSGLGYVKCLDAKSKQSSDFNYEKLCFDSDSLNLESPPSVRVALKGAYSGRTKDESSVFRFSKEDATSKVVLVSLRNNFVVFSSSFEIRPLPNTLSIKDPKNKEKTVNIPWDLNLNNSKIDSIEKSPFKISLIEQSPPNTQSLLGLSVTLNDPDSLKERTCFKGSSESNLEISEGTYNEFSQFKYMTIWVRSKADTGPTQAIAFTNLSYLRFRFVP